MPVARALALALVLVLVGACTGNSGDFESNCTKSCSLPDGGIAQETIRIACCGVHDNPTHSGEEGTDCTPDWVQARIPAFCAGKQIQYFANGCPAFVDCQGNVSYRCDCEAPHTYPSFEGCD